MLRKSHLFLLFGLGIAACRTADENAPEGFQVEKGFQLERVAAEPLIKDPVDLAFDENGVAYVLEMPGYPFEDQSSRVVRLWDLNDDHTYDSSSVYAENLQLASSIMPYRQGLLVAAPPYLLFVKDNDGDHRAEAVDTLMGGFSTGNLQHNYNGLTFGTDNHIYAVNGGNSGAPFWWPDSSRRLNIRGNDFRFTLRESEGEVLPGQMELVGASSHGFELAMDPAGRLFETHNMEHISHLVFPDRYRKGTRLLKDQGLDNISDHEEMGTARIYPIGEQESRVNHPEQSGYFSGGCGVCFYDGGAFGPEYDNTIWVADVVLNLLHVDKLQSDGATLKASRVLEGRDVLASEDRSFRPVNMTVGPDGALYVLDFHRKVIEHPEWIPDDIEKTLDLESGKDKGRIYRLSRKGTTGTFSPDQLADDLGRVNALFNPNQWVARTAQRLLVESDQLTDIQLNKLNELISKFISDSDRWPAALRALWTLHHHNRLGPDHALRALQSQVPSVRENGLMLSERSLDIQPALVETAIILLADPDQRVRMQAALSLSLLGDQSFAEHRTALFDALAGCAKLEADEWTVSGLTLASRRDPAAMFRKVAESEESASRNQFLTALALVACADEKQVVSIMKQLGAERFPASLQKSIIRQLLANLQEVGDKSQWLPMIAAVEAQGDTEVISSLAALRKKWALPPSDLFLALSRDAVAKLSKTDLPDTIRQQQLGVVALLPFRQTAEALYSCLNNTEPIALQEGALRILADQNDAEVGRRLVQQWPDLGPQARKWASDLLLYKHIHHDALLTGLEKKVINIGEMNFDLERRRELLWWTDDMTTRRRAEALFSDSGVSTRKEAFETASAALKLTGDAAQGSSVFANVCGNCHRFNEVGQEVGPVLTEIGRKSKEAILHEIVDPNSAVDPRYINHRVDTREGKVYTGIVAKETDQYVTLRRMGGEEITVYKKDITRFTSLGTSLMMEGLETSMSNQQMADLLAYLTRI